MRVHSLDKRYLLDRVSYEAFLRGPMGFTDEQLSWLSVYIRRRSNNPDVAGHYGRNMLYVFTHDRCLQNVTETLLHETRHHWQYWQRIEASRRAEAEAALLTGRRKQKVLDQARTLFAHEKHLPYA